MKQKRDHKNKNTFWRICGRVCGVLGAALVALLLIGGIAVGVIAARVDHDADMEIMEMMRTSRTTRLYAPDGTVEREALTIENYVPTEVDILWGDENMVWAQSEEIPDALRQAFVSIEDRRFYEHHGVEWGRTAYAALNQVFRFRARFGGSTITQQLIKNVHGDRDISVVRKVKEIVRALRLEKEYSKDEILTYYLNIVPLGHGCMGVKSAARYYFNKELSELDVLECAALAAITNAPSKFEPVGHIEENSTRREKVLQAMYENGYLTVAAYEACAGQSLTLDVTDPIYTDNRHSWYTETVITDVIQDLMRVLDISESAAHTMVWRGGLEIYTLEDVRVQKALEDVFARENVLRDAAGRRIEAGVTVCDPYTGDLLGVIGGTGDKSGSRLFNRATDGYYQPGSALKPLALYGPALEWKRIHYATIFEDLPEETGVQYWPHNSPDLYMGRVTAHRALALSKNTVAVQLLRLLGEENVYRHLRDTIGLAGLIDGEQVSDMAAAPLALGQLSYGVTVREMTGAYAAFVNGGERVSTGSYLAVYDAKGAPLLRREREYKRIWSEETAFLMTQMLREVVEDGTARRITLKEVVDTAGKTGTSGADKDKWFVGYTPYYVTGLHLAYDDRTPLPSSERRHLTLWDEVMQCLHDGLGYEEGGMRSFTMPDGITEAEYCIDSGCIPTDACRAEVRGDRTRIGYFRSDTLPYEVCDVHIAAHYDMVDGEYAPGRGEDAADIDFYVLSIPGRPEVIGITPQDYPYTLEYLLEHEIGNDATVPEEENDGVM